MQWHGVPEPVIQDLPSDLMNELSYATSTTVFQQQLNIGQVLFFQNMLKVLNM